MNMERTVERICADELVDLIKRPGVLLIDTRDRDSFEKGHISSAMHATTGELERLLFQIPKSAPVVIYCYHGNASLVHGQMFVDFGFEEVYSLNGGYEGWIHLNGGARNGRLFAWLADHGFSGVNSTLDGDNTPLMLSSRTGNSSIVAELLVAGARIDARNSDGNQALWFACFSGSLEIMDLLIASGVDIDNMNDNGATCLMYAASSGKDAVVAKLLEAGADISLKNFDDFTALDMASSLGCLQLLRQAEKQPLQYSESGI